MITMKRMKANDPVAIERMGIKHYEEVDYESAFEYDLFDYWTKAADVGDAIAHYDLSFLYSEGQGVEKDQKKELFHLEEAAIGGHPEAR